MIRFKRIVAMLLVMSMVFQLIPIGNISFADNSNNDEMTIITDNISPTIPGELKADNVTQNSVTINWLPSFDSLTITHIFGNYW